MKPPVPNERQVQRSILQMAGYAFPSVLIFHIPNGAHLAGTPQERKRQMGILLGDGVKPGMCDLVAVWNHGIAFLEVKRPGYTPSCVSPQQRQIHAQLSEMGFTPAIVTSPGEAFAFLVERGAPTNIRAWREAA